MTCSLCDKPVYSQRTGWCAMHFKRWRRNGDPNIVGNPSQFKLGHGLKGNDISYHGAHDRVRRAKGKASAHKCVDCGLKAREWSYTHVDPDELTGSVTSGGRTYTTTYSANPDFHVPRCNRCHQHVDQPGHLPSDPLRIARLQIRGTFETQFSS